MNYTYSVADNRVYCMTFFAGKTVKGVAKCDPTDEFNLEDGKKLAKARCNVKVAKKKLKIKTQRRDAAIRELAVAQYHMNKAQEYTYEAELAYEACIEELEKIEAQLS